MKDNITGEFQNQVMLKKQNQKKIIRNENEIIGNSSIFFAISFINQLMLKKQNQKKIIRNEKELIGN